MEAYWVSPVSVSKFLIEFEAHSTRMMSTIGIPATVLLMIEDDVIMELRGLGINTGNAEEAFDPLPLEESKKYNPRTAVGREVTKQFNDRSASSNEIKCYRCKWAWFPNLLTDL